MKRELLIERITVLLEELDERALGLVCAFITGILNRSGRLKK